jgi:uncharacterized protein (UPF0335 family)
MSGIGDNSGVHADKLLAYVQRIEADEASIAELNANKSETYKELRGEGFDAKTVRRLVGIRKQDPAKRQEAEELLELYAKALGVAL